MSTRTKMPNWGNVMDGSVNIDDLYDECILPSSTSENSSNKSNITDIVTNIDSFHMVTPLKDAPLDSLSVKPIDFKLDDKSDKIIKKEAEPIRKSPRKRSTSNKVSPTWNENSTKFKKPLLTNRLSSDNVSNKKQIKPKDEEWLHSSKDVVSEPKRKGEVIKNAGDEVKISLPFRRGSRNRSSESEKPEADRKRSRNVSSNSSNVSETDSPQPKRRPVEIETDPEVLARRQKQIDYGKNTVGYDRYLEKVPKNKRTRGHPSTPPKHHKFSRRAWDGLVKVWRQDLHNWDPDVEKGNGANSDLESNDTSLDDSLLLAD